MSGTEPPLQSELHPQQFCNGCQLGTLPFPCLSGTRDPASEKVAALLASQPGATADGIPATVDWAEVLQCAAAAGPLVVYRL